MNVIMRSILKEGNNYHYEAVTDLPAYSTSMDEAEKEILAFLSVKNMTRYYPEEIFRRLGSYKYNEPDRGKVTTNIKILQDFITDRYVIIFQSKVLLPLPEYSIEE